MKYSKNFERDYVWYLKWKDTFTFDGNANTSDKVIFSKTGKSAKECFYLYDSQGKIIPTNEPELLFQLHKCKGSINFNIKMWVEGLKDGTLPRCEFDGDSKILVWTIKYKKWVKYVPKYFIKKFRIEDKIPIANYSSNLIEHYELLDWMIKAIENQLKKKI